MLRTCRPTGISVLIDRQKASPIMVVARGIKYFYRLTYFEEKEPEPTYHYQELLDPKEWEERQELWERDGKIVFQQLDTVVEGFLRNWAQMEARKAVMDGR